MSERTKGFSLVSGTYYYLALTVLAFSIALVSYWQLEEDFTVINFQEIEYVSNENEREFYIPISFCNKRITDFQIHRYYLDTAESIYYSLPTTQYMSEQLPEQDCFQTMLMANTNGLREGVYEYRVFISYHINPVQRATRLISKAYVTVE